MRVIEKEMLQAITSIEKGNTTSWKSGNTAVFMEDGFVAVSLHGHKIAMLTGVGGTINHCGYMTSTTKSRLNAVLTTFGLGFGISQKNWEWYLTTNYNGHKEVTEMKSGWNLIRE